MMMNNLSSTIDKSLILVYNVCILKERDFVMKSKDEVIDGLLNDVKRRNSVLDALNLCYIYLTAMNKSKQNSNNNS